MSDSKAAKKKPAAKRPATAKPEESSSASVKSRAARDPYRGPSATRIEQSLKHGTSITLDHFRSLIKWS